MFMEELATLFCMLAFALEDFEVDSFAGEEDEEDEAGEEDFILTSFAIKAGAKVLTTASRSDCFDRDCTTKGQRQMECQAKIPVFDGCRVYMAYKLTLASHTLFNNF